MARSVFFDALDLDRIVVTSFVGLNRRAFTLPGLGQAIYCNVGGSFDEIPQPLLIHELAHALQISRGSRTRFLQRGIVEQTQFLFGRQVYNYDGPARDWLSWNQEQQASIVEHWFSGVGKQAEYGPMSEISPYYHYIRENVREYRST